MNPDSIDGILAEAMMTHRNLTNAIALEASDNFDTPVVFVDTDGNPVAVREICLNSAGVVEIRLKT